MVSLPPDVWAELFYSGSWNPVSRDVRATKLVSVTRGLSSESASAAEPASGEITLNNRGRRYSPRDPSSVTSGAGGRNMPIRYGYNVGSPWAEMTGTLGNKLTTPDSAALAVTDLDVRVEVALEDWSVATKLAGRYEITGDQRSWALLVAATGQVNFLWSPDGTLASRIVQLSTEGIRAYNGQRLALRVTLDVDNGASGYELRFYTGRTVDDTEWNLLGAPIVGGATTSVFDGTTGIELGDVEDLSDNALNGKLYAFRLLNGIAGTTAASMRTSDAAPGATSFTSGGAVWTVAGSATLTNRHVRMSGEVPEWPVTRDRSGNESNITLAPAGVSRRMDAGNKPQDSALLRYIKALGPVECWPLTDGPETAAGQSLVGGSAMRQDIKGTDTAAVWQGGRLADWIEPVLSAKANTTGFIRGLCRRTAGTDAFWSVDLFLTGGGTPSSGQFTVYDRGAGTDSENQVSIQMIFTGSLDRITVVRVSDGDTSQSSALLSNVDSVGIYNEAPHHIRLTIDPQPVAVNTLWYLYVDGTLRGSGSIASIVMQSARSILLGWGYATISGVTMTDRSFGYVTYWDGTGPTAADIYSAYRGFQGERAGDRIERLAAEGGYTASAAGESVYQRRMGIQGRKKLLELLNEASVTNFGYLVDARDRAEVVHRGQSTLWSQRPALVIDFSAGLVSDYKYRDDDLLTENDVSVKREYGASASRQVLDEGAMSVQDYPDGVGRYDREYTYSLYEDDDAAQTAYLRLHIGTYGGVRFTKLTLDLANPRVHQMIDDILRADCGDLIRLTGLPADHGPDDVDVLINGYTEEADAAHWTISFVGVPAEPWTSGNVALKPSTVVEDFEDATLAITVADSGSLPWLRTNAQAHTGSWSFRSGAISNNQFSTATVTVPAGATALLFWYRTSSEAAGSGFEGDRLTVNVDGQQVLRAQGTTGWTEFAVDVTGRAAVAFTYTKDNSTAVGEDAVYIDDVVFTIPNSLTSEARADTGGCELAEALDETETDVSVLTTGLYRWVDSQTYPADFPFLVRTGAEVMRVVSCSGTTTSQTFTVIRGVNGVRLTHPSGQDIRLAYPVYAAM